MEDIEKLVKALRCDELDCVDCEWQEKCNGVPGCLIRHAAADALESLRAENEHIRSNCYARDGVQAIIDERDRFKAERDAAVKCIEDIYTYLCLGSEKYIARTIQRWMGAKEANHG